MLTKPQLIAVKLAAEPAWGRHIYISFLKTESNWISKWFLLIYTGRRKPELSRILLGSAPQEAH